KCTHCGAVMKTANPIAPGKKVKCPKCAQAFVVQEEEGEKKPAAKEEAASAPDAAGDDDLDFSAKPKGKKNGKTSDDDDDGKKKKPAKKGGKGMLIGLLVGGALLLCCCCPGGGAGEWWYYANIYSKPAFIGSWEKKTEKGAAIPIEFLISFENNNTGRYDNFLEKLTGKHNWKLIDEKTVEITMNAVQVNMNDVQVNSKETNKLWTGSFSGRFTFTVAGDDLTLVNTADQKSTKLKRK